MWFLYMVSSGFLVDLCVFFIKHVFCLGFSDDGFVMFCSSGLPNFSLLKRPMLAAGWGVFQENFNT